MIKNLTLSQALNYHNHLVQVTAALAANMGLAVDPIRTERIIKAAEALVDESWRKMGFEIDAREAADTDRKSGSYNAA